MARDRPLALVTNDDGIDSPGLALLAGRAEAAGFDVLVAAPGWDSSGASASLTAVEEGGRVVVREHVIPGIPRNRCLAVEAAPAFIVRAAASGAFGDRPDLVLSGVNLGANTGHVVLHSGTVGAALTASTYGLPSLAVSLAEGAATYEERWCWATAEAVLDEVLPRLHESDREQPPVFNVNVPAVALDAYRGVTDARLARFGAVQANVTEAGRGWVRLDFAPAEGDLEPGTDAALLAEGWATLTRLVAVSEAAPVPAGAAV